MLEKQQGSFGLGYYDYIFGLKTFSFLDDWELLKVMPRLIQALNEDGQMLIFEEYLRRSWEGIHLDHKRHRIVRSKELLIQALRHFHHQSELLEDYRIPRCPKSERRSDFMPGTPRNLCQLVFSKMPQTKQSAKAYRKRLEASDELIDPRRLVPE